MISIRRLVLKEVKYRKEVLSFLKMVKQIYGDKDDVIIGMEVAPEGVSPDNLLESLTAFCKML